MRTANILSFSETPQGTILDTYKEYLGIKTKEHEDECLKLLYKLLHDNNAPIEIYDKFYIDYSIPQISKQFDLLRVSANSVVNIELKSSSNEEAITKQLKKNHYYLSSLGKKVHLYTFVQDTGRLYFLNNNQEIEAGDISNLIKRLEEQDNIYDGNLDEQFMPSNYLISPFNSTQRFVNGEYFLTGHQENIKTEIDNSFQTSSGQIISLEGKAGTGKTLLLYDYAKQHIDDNKKILIVHVGYLNTGQDDLNTLGWDICPIKSMKFKLENSNYDFIIIDETQRIYPNQLDFIFDFIQKNKVNCIFGFDSNQTLCEYETNSPVISSIENKSNKKFTLTEKIRTNKNLAQFIRTMFNLKKKDETIIKNVSIIHFNSHDTALQYINIKDDFDFINYTQSQYYKSAIDKFDSCSQRIGNSHQVIGQEFDNVLTILDDIFFYDEDGLLNCKDRKGNPYEQTKMFFQAVTRVKKKLEIVVINNPNLFKELLKIIN